MKKVYIAHPLRGAERKKNVQETTRICQKIMALFPEILPVSPIHAFSFLDGGGAEGEKKALALCLETVKQCNELWLFGEWKNSYGCQSEWAIANRAKIKIIDFSPQTVEYMPGLDKMRVFLDWLHFEVYKPALKPCPFCGNAAPEMYRLLKTMCDAFASFSYGGDEKRAEKILRKIDKDEKEKMQR